MLDLKDFSSDLTKGQHIIFRDGGSDCAALIDRVNKPKADADPVTVDLLFNRNNSGDWREAKAVRYDAAGKTPRSWRLDKADAERYVAAAAEDAEAQAANPSSAT